MMTDIGMNDWKYQIIEILEDKIIKDFFNLKIIVEADLQSSVFTFLNDFISRHQNPRWRVFNQMGQISDKEKNKYVYPDILLTQNKVRRVAIELKQGVERKNNVKLSDVIDDINKMGKYGNKYDVETYVIYTCYQNRESFESDYDRLERVSSEYAPNSPNIIMINLQDHPGHSRWRTLHREYLEEWTGLYSS